MCFAIYTFADEAYVPAVVALVNSLRHHGFAGEIHIGSPESLSIATMRPPNILFHALGPSEYWPGNRKVELILAHPSSRFVFLDADVLLTDAAFLVRLGTWMESGPVFAVEALVAPIDYRRRAWSQRMGRSASPSLWPMHYFNSGLFAGVIERDRPLLEAWDQTTRQVLQPPAKLFDDPDFPMSDQDTLNAVLQDWSSPPIGIGPPDIWAAASPSHPFFHVGSFPRPAILHCTGQDKPWKLMRVPPRAPTVYDARWYRHVVEPLGPLHIELHMSPLLRSWFEGGRAGSVTARLKSLVRRLTG